MTAFYLVWFIDTGKELLLNTKNTGDLKNVLKI